MVKNSRITSFHKLFGKLVAVIVIVLSVAPPGGA